MKCFAFLRRSSLKVLVKHLFPTRRMNAGGVSDYTVEIEQNGVVPITGDRVFAFGLPRRPRFICFAHSSVLPVFNPQR